MNNLKKIDSDTLLSAAVSFTVVCVFCACIAGFYNEITDTCYLELEEQEKLAGEKMQIQFADNGENALKDKFPFLEVGSIGVSILSKTIPYIRIGNGPNEVFYSAAIHAKWCVYQLPTLDFL